MPYQDTEVKALERVSNKYLLTVLVCKRVKQLQRGAKPLIAEDNLNPFDTALKEIATGKIVLAESSAEPPPDIPVETPSNAVEQNVQPDSIESNEPSSAAAGA